MNKARRLELERASTLIGEPLEIIENCAAEEREAFENMPESLQNGERGQATSEAADALEEAVSALQDVSSNIDAAVQS